MRFLVFIAVFYAAFGLVAVQDSCQNEVEPPPDHEPPVSPRPPDDIIPPDDTQSTTTSVIVNDCSRFVSQARVGKPPDEDYTLSCWGATDMLWDLCKQRQDLMWDGLRNPAFALQNCPDQLFLIELKASELETFVAAGQGLLPRLDRFFSRLQSDHPSCEGKTVVNKDFYKAFQRDLQSHLAMAGYFNHQTQQDPCREHTAYDNLRGWCQKCYK
jgi:hypothetical protein